MWLFYDQTITIFHELRRWHGIFLAEIADKPFLHFLHVCNIQNIYIKEVYVEKSLKQILSIRTRCREIHSKQINRICFKKVRLYS